jgi:carboxymethylenebutenolidase
MTSPNLTRPDGSQPQDFHMTRRGIASLLFTGYAAAAVSASAEPITTDTAGLVTDTIMINPNLPAYVARPAGPGPHPAVIVVSEIFGVHEWVRDVARRFAKAGYVAIAPNFFFRADPENTLPGLKDFPAILKIVGTAGIEQVMGDVGATLGWLKAQKSVDASRLFLTGYCWGGGVTWMAAERFSELKAGGAWYGVLTPRPPGGMLYEAGRKWPIEGVADLKCPVLGLYGGKDKGIPATDVEAMRAALAKAGKDGPKGSQLILYPDADHGFLADYRPSYNPDAAKDAWTKLLAFFKAHGSRVG